MLVVVSNRVASPTGKDAGGLAVALKGLLKANGGMWVGWSGRCVSDPEPGEPQSVSHDGIQYLTVDLVQQDFDQYYGGFSNRVLWPLMHARPDLIEFQREEYDGYQRVNRRFADILASRLGPDDIVWIHDYHLIPLARHLRSAGVRNRIGFFLHIPVPSPDLAASLPDHAELFGALTDCDLVGVQTVEDAERLQAYFGKLRDDGLRAGSAPDPRIEAHPISIDTATIERLAADAATHPQVERLARSLDNRALVVGVDRLDYSKGLPERFRAFGRYLDNCGEQGEQGRQASMLQIAPPSRGAVPEYRALRRELEQCAGHINGKFARPDWVPIRYVNCSYPHEVLSGFYRLARAALVTPLRDGMNLVAKEYVAAQDPADPGVLVLSRFAGAADELAGGAVLVNPYDTDAMAESLEMALQMPLDERVQRWERMIAVLRARDIRRWGADFLASLEDGQSQTATVDADQAVAPMQAAGIPERSARLPAASRRSARPVSWKDGPLASLGRLHPMARGAG